MPFEAPKMYQKLFLFQKEPKNEGNVLTEI